jgi:cyclase
MLAKRIIAALDIKNGRVVKGVNFENLREIGDPASLGKRYSENGIDELVLLDIAATIEERKTFVACVAKVAEQVSIPFCVGGGVKQLTDVEALLEAGADKVFVNSAAVKEPAIVNNLARRFGSQCIVVAIDAAFRESGWQVFINGGKLTTNLELISWAKKVEELGAGEILFTSIDHDGAKNGYANHGYLELSQALSIPIIASGGAGTMQHFEEVFIKGQADAALAASVFHDQEINPLELKKYLSSKEVHVRS